MCYNIKQTKSAKQLAQHCNVDFKKGENYIPSDVNGFEFKQTPIITNAVPANIQLYNWGLIPDWANDVTIRKNTLNAKIETIDEKPSYKGVVNNRCIVLVDGFYEWQWLDKNGKRKQKYEITLPDDVAFGLAGLFNIWNNNLTGETIETFTILTTDANEQMAEIHNSKKRMPIVIPSGFEGDWFHKGKVPVEKVLFKTKKLHQNIQTKLPF